MPTLYPSLTPSHPHFYKSDRRGGEYMSVCKRTQNCIMSDCDEERGIGLKLI